MIAYLLLFQSFLRFCAIVLLICVFQVPCCIWWWLGNSRIVICNNSDFSQPVHCKHLNLIKSEYGFQPTPWWTSVRQQVPHTSKPSHWFRWAIGLPPMGQLYQFWQWNLKCYTKLGTPTLESHCGPKNDRVMPKRLKNSIFGCFFLIRCILYLRGPRGILSRRNFLKIFLRVTFDTHGTL